MKPECYFKDCKQSVIGTKTNYQGEVLPICTEHYDILWKLYTSDEAQEKTFHKIEESHEN